MEQKRTAVFPGTFDPFTIGHRSIVDRALNLVDEIVVAVGVNVNKQTYLSLDDRIRIIEDLYRDEPRVKAMPYDMLTVDFAKKVNAGFILRGVRNIGDFEYEKNIADINRQLAGIETVVLFTEPEYAHISSGMVRELLQYGRDISSFVPSNIQSDKKKKEQ